MSQENAPADLRAAAYWRNVAAADRADIGMAVAKVNQLTTAARQDTKEPASTPRRSRGLGAV